MLNELLTPTTLQPNGLENVKIQRRPNDYLQFSEFRPVAQEIVLNEIHGGYLSSYDRIGIAKLVEQRLEAKDLPHIGLAFSTLQRPHRRITLANREILSLRL